MGSAEVVQFGVAEAESGGGFQVVTVDDDGNVSGRYDAVLPTRELAELRAQQVAKEVARLTGGTIERQL
jgi:hypothetical protein